MGQWVDETNICSSTIFGVSAIGTALVNQILSLVPLLIVILTTVHRCIYHYFLALAILLLAFFTLGIGLILFNPFDIFPDVSEMYQILLTAWMYLTPIIYPRQLSPKTFYGLSINPMYRMVKMFRLSIYEGRLPLLAEFLPALGWLWEF